MSRTFTAVYIQHGDWYAAFADELPGANTQGRTLDEARDNLRDAIELLLEEESEAASGLPLAEDRLDIPCGPPHRYPRTPHDCRSRLADAPPRP